MAEEVEKTKKKNKRNKSKVKFEEESIDKQKAVEVLSHVNENNSEEKHVDKENLNNHEAKTDKMEETNNVKKQKKSKKRKASKLEPEEANTDSNDIKEDSECNKTNESEGNWNKTKKKKRKSTNNTSNETTENETEEPKVDNPEKPGETKESIRAQRRRKHLQLQEEKKKKALLVTQSNVLNYLSKWKHARSEWKFEKLKQIWLAQNLFEPSKVPDDFWATALEYFEASKGFIRNLVLRESIKIIEAEDQAEEANPDEDYQSKVKRARDIVQTLQ